MTIVVDSNIFIALSVIDEPFHMQAKQILSLWQSTHTQLIAPHLFKSEVTAVLRKVVYQNRITHQQGTLILQRLLSYPIQFYEDDTLLKRAFELAQIYNRPRAYDTQYLALAEQFTCDFWTLDERLFNAVKTQMPFVYWLGNWKKP